jgi:hypothetical protein
METEIYIKLIISLISFFSVLAISQLFIIAKSLNDIKNKFGILETKHDYLNERVKNLETQKYK